jgi:nucleoside-diphosphate-sugar epimerase
VAVTGPTGTFGMGLMPLLQADQRVARVIGVARRPFDPAALGWTKMNYRRGDVRDRDALKDAFRGADVVVHLAFWITGTASREETRSVNVEGTVGAFRAAAEAGVHRFVYASSVAAYGFHRDNPIGMTEAWPVRPAKHLFYAQEKAEVEQLLEEETAISRNIDLYVLRPPIVLGPHAVGAKEVLPGSLATLLRMVTERAGAALPLLPLTAAATRLAQLGGRAAVALPRYLAVPVPAYPMQFIHEDDVGEAILLCVLGAGPAGAYNIAADDVITTRDVARDFGLATLPFPSGLAQRLAGTLAAFPRPPVVPPAADWIEAASHPSIMDTTKAKSELGWTPKYSALEALRSVPALQSLRRAASAG